jgi:hypothetical protein
LANFAERSLKLTSRHFSGFEKLFVAKRRYFIVRQAQKFTSKTEILPANLFLQQINKKGGKLDLKTVGWPDKVLK